MHGQQLHAYAHDHKCVGIKLAISTVKIKDVVSDPRDSFALLMEVKIALKHSTI